MIETLMLSVIFAKTKIYLKLGRLQIQKESYLIKPILKYWSIYPVILMSIFYVYLQTTIISHNYFFLPYQHLIKTAILLSYMILGFVILIKNDKNKEFILSCCSLLSGSILNNIVMHFNNNRMPIFPSLSYATGYTQYNMIINASRYGDFHMLGNYTTKLIFLSDVFDVGGSIWSIGDILIRLFAFLIVYHSIKTVNKFQ